MSNILNAHLSSVNNLIPARRIKKEGRSRVLESPQNIYQYSIDDELDKKNQLRQDVKSDYFISKSKKKHPILKLLALIAIPVTGFMLIKGIKK